MRQLRLHLASVLVVLALGKQAALSQSDSQTLRSPAACLGNITDLDLGISVRDGRRHPLSLGLQTIGVYQINPRFTVGMGVGLHSYGPGHLLLLPLFVDGRMHFPQRKWTPFVSLDAGYALSLQSDARGGVLVNPAVGGRIPFAENAALSLSIGYRWQGNQGQVKGVLEEFRPEYLSAKVGVVTRFPRLSYKVFSKTLRRMKEKTPTPR